MAKRPLPAPAEAARRLSDLLGKPVDAKKGAPVAVEAKSPAAIGAYVLGDGHLGALCVCDMGLAVSLSAALALIPRGAAAERCRGGKLPEEFLENLKEVLNVLSGLFNPPGTPHVSLGSVHMTPDSFPQEVAEFAAHPGARLDLGVCVPGYDGGAMSLLVA